MYFFSVKFLVSVLRAFVSFHVKKTLHIATTLAASPFHVTAKADSFHIATTLAASSSHVTAKALALCKFTSSSLSWPQKVLQVQSGGETYLLSPKPLMNLVFQAFIFLKTKLSVVFKNIYHLGMSTNFFSWAQIQIFGGKINNKWIELKLRFSHVWSAFSSQKYCQIIFGLFKDIHSSNWQD